jgi:hypothetical protein
MIRIIIDQTEMTQIITHITIIIIKIDKTMIIIQQITETITNK